MRLPTFQIINADVIEGLKQIPDESVDVIVTSPPYWKQRTYGGVEGQIGHEPTSEEYVQKMINIFYHHCGRVLKEHGLLFLNLGDSYNGSGGDNGGGGVSIVGEGALSKADPYLKPKDLMNIPHRVYEGLQRAGYWWRSTIIWAKTNGAPESVMGVRWERHKIKVGNIPMEETIWKKRKLKGQNTVTGVHSEVLWKNCDGCEKCEKTNGYVLRWGSGRPTNRIEYIGVFAKSDKYYWDTEAVRQPYAEISNRRRKYANSSFGGNEDGAKLGKRTDRGGLEDKYTGSNAVNILQEEEERPLLAWLSREYPEIAEEYASQQTLWSDLWEMPTASYKEKHYATFPLKLPEFCIKAGSSEFGCCSVCGAPYARILDRFVGEYRNERRADGTGYTNRRSKGDIFAQSTSTVLKTVGWAPTCEHKDAEVVPAVVLDPFGGSGTTALVANRLGRDAISIEINPEYVEIQRKRLMEDAPLFNRRETCENVQLEIQTT